MRKLLASLAVVGLLFTTSGCTSKTEYGPCVGMWDDEDRQPNLKYKLSAWNTFWGIVGVELIFPPILVLHHETFCPVGVKSPQEVTK